VFAPLLPKLRFKVWGKCVHCYANWLLEEDWEDVSNSYTAAGDGDSSNVRHQSWASSSQEIPFAFPKSASSRPKRPMDQRSPQVPNPAPSKTAHTQLPTLPAVPPLPAGPLVVATAPVVTAPMVNDTMAPLPAGPLVVATAPVVTAPMVNDAMAPLPAGPLVVASAPVVTAPMANDAMARLTVLCRRSGERPEVLDETLLDAELGTWKVTMRAVGRCTVGIGQGKKAAKQHAAQQLLEGSV
jgi:hypothetical protein